MGRRARIHCPGAGYRVMLRGKGGVDNIGTQNGTDIPAIDGIALTIR